MTKTLAIALLAACAQPTVTATSPDAGSQPPPPPPPMADAGPDLHGDLAVSVIDPLSGLPANGARVVFTDADSSQSIAADSHGRATASVLPGASVTAIIAEPGSGTFLLTVLAAQPGDDLVLGAFADGFTDEGNFQVSFQPLPGATSYDVYGPCGSTFVGGAPFVTTLRMQKDCVQNDMDIIVVARDKTGAVMASADRVAPFINGGSVTVDTPYVHPIGISASYVNTAGMSSILLDRGAPDDLGFEASGTAIVIGNGAIATAAGVVARTALVESTIASATHATGRQVIADAIDGTANHYDLNVAAALLPWLDEMALDPTTGTVTIVTDSQGTTTDAGDVFQTELRYTRGGNAFRWQIVAPTAATFTLPAIDGMRPQPGDAIGLVAGLTIDTDDAHGYDDVRANAFGFADVFRHGHRLPASTTRARLSRF